MTASRRENPKVPAVHKEKKVADGLLTSEDLFGDIVDAVPEPVDRPAATRKAPIRVQVSEPAATAGPPSAKSKIQGEELRPEEMAALLDAFSEPGEAMMRARVEEPPRPAAPAPAAASEPVPAPVEPVSLFDELDALPGDEPVAPGEDDLLDAVLEPPVPTGPPSMPTKTMPRAPLPPQPEEIPALTRPSARLGTKFHAATPQTASAPGGLDLAALAEAAIGTRPAGSAPRPAASGGSTVGVTPTASLPVGSPPAAEPSPNYGPYRLLERVAVGGMAEVFKAKRTGVEGFEKVVAVKRILPHLSDNKEFVDMFINEAKVVAGLTHPSVVQIYDLGRIERSYYIAMEYVHGRDLRSIQKRAKERGLKIPMDLAAMIVSRVCSALEYAHRKKDDRGRPMKIVHRDVSPQNILIAFEGEVKLTDFGIAKAATKATHTDAGALRGKLLYMSPEQAWGKPMDRRSDLFSLGIVFYEMLTEQRPFLAQTEMSILEMVRQCRVAPPSGLNPRIPERLEKVVMKALEKDADVRYQDAGEMGRDLERALAAHKPPTATELARFMEILFDEDERGAVSGEEASGVERSLGHLEMEFDTSPPTGHDRDRPEPEPRPAKDPMSIQKLLKRFGIK
jgi:serine/threonine protein kinase